MPSVPTAAAAAARSSASGAVPKAHGHGPGPADVAGQAPGVDAGQGRDAVAAQEGLEALGGPPVGRLVGQVAHHDPPAVRRGGLVVGGVRPVVADVRAGEGDDLARRRTGR